MVALLATAIAFPHDTGEEHTHEVELEEEFAVEESEVSKRKTSELANNNSVQNADPKPESEKSEEQQIRDFSSQPVNPIEVVKPAKPIKPETCTKDEPAKDICLGRDCIAVSNRSS